MRLAIGADKDDFEAILHFKSELDPYPSCQSTARSLRVERKEAETKKDEG